MPNPVAPGPSGYNLLSKRNLFRVVLLRSKTSNPQSALRGPLVLESKDGSYHYEWELKDAENEDGYLVFDTYMRDRERQYVCYFKDQQKGRFHWSSVPRKLVDLSHT